MRIGLVTVLVFMLVSCAHEEFVFDDGWPPVTIHEYPEGLVYEGGNTESDTVVVFLNGGGPTSVLGAREGDRSMKDPSFFYRVLHYYGDEASVITPEKPNALPGKSHRFDSEFLRTYTISNVINQYAAVLDHYLFKNDSGNVSIIGTSEGALVLPAVYTAMEEKDRVKKLVPIAGGGISFYDLANLQNDHGPAGTAHLFWELVEKNPDSIEDVYQQVTYKYWYSWKGNSPIEHYKAIDIPVLFVHGLKDTRVPPESSMYVEAELPDKPFEYLYVEGVGHNLGTRQIRDKIFDCIGEWMGISSVRR